MELDYYDELARIQDDHWWYRGRAAIVRRVMSDHLPPVAGPREILDVGCGPGAMFDLLETFGHVRGVDTEEAAVQLARERGHAAAAVYDGVRLPFEDASFDIVSAFDVIEHIPDDRLALEDMRRLLRPDGRIVLTVPALPRLWSEHDEISHHQRRYTRRSLIGVLTGAGLDIELISSFNAVLLAPIAAARVLMPRRGDRDAPKSDFDRTPGGTANEVFFRLMAAEAPLVSGRGLPLGVSLIAVARG